MKRWLKDERGNTTVAIVFTVLATILIGSVLSTVVVMIVSASTAATYSSMRDAIDQRFQAYIDNPSVTSAVEYQADNSNVSITGTSTNGAVTTVTLEAVYGNGRTDTETRAYSGTNGSLIIGYDSAGNPVW